jgi:hypothetical protein
MFYCEEFAWRLNEAFGLLLRYEVITALNRKVADFSLLCAATIVWFSRIAIVSFLSMSCFTYKGRRTEGRLGGL